VVLAVSRESDARRWAADWMARQVLRRLGPGGIDAAAGVPSCPPPGIVPPECAALQGLPAPTTPAERLHVNRLRGACNEQQLLQMLCSRHYLPQHQVRLDPGPAGGGAVVLDVQPFGMAPRRLPHGLEAKYMHAVDARGQPRSQRAIERAVRAYVNQARRQMQVIAQTGAVQRGLAPTVRLFFRVGGAPNAQAFQRIATIIYNQVWAMPGSPPVGVTVVPAGMPGAPVPAGWRTPRRPGGRAPRF
jgi:hypothetical protein